MEIGGGEAGAKRRGKAAAGLPDKKKTPPTRSGPLLQRQTHGTQGKPRWWCVPERLKNRLMQEGRVMAKNIMMNAAGLSKLLRGTCGGKCASSSDFGRGIRRIIGGAGAEARSGASHIIRPPQLSSVSNAFLSTGHRFPL